MCGGDAGDTEAGDLYQEKEGPMNKSNYFSGLRDDQLELLRVHLEHCIALIDSGGAAQMVNRKTGKPQKQIPMPWMRKSWTKAIKLIKEEQQNRYYLSEK